MENIEDEGPERARAPVPNYRIRILTPHVGPENIEALKDNKPFIMRAELEVAAKFIQVIALPTLVDMLGFSGGGGPPAYGFLVGAGVTATKPVLFLSLTPDTPFYLPPPLNRIDFGLGPVGNEVLWEVLGITQSMGALLTHFMLRGPGIGAYLAEAKSEDIVVVNMIDYQIPELLQTKILPGRMAQATKP